MRVLLALIVFACCTADARASTVAIERFADADFPSEVPDYANVVVAGAPGEANDLSVSTREGIVVRDAGAPLTAGAGCQAQGDGSVRCASAVRLSEVDVDAGDGNDRIVTDDAVPGRLHGGPGDDVITVPADAHRTGVLSNLYGEDGDDVLSGTGALQGGPGSDRLTGGPGGDWLMGGPGSDVIDGGAGRDYVSFGDDTAGVVVDLADPGLDGGDRLIGIEQVEGGSGNDHIAGDDGKNWLLGGPGRDVIEGRGGDDLLDGEIGDDRVDGGAGDDAVNGGGGHDRLRGGAGDDELYPRGFRPSDTATLSCGSGSDHVFSPPRTTLVPHDCERVVAGSFDVDRLRLGRTLRLRIRAAPDLPAACSTTITVTARGHRIGFGAVRMRGRIHRMTIRLLRPAADVRLVFRAPLHCGRSGGPVVGGFRLRR
jgi:Ca2+-binding RTX toxin-like protein